MTSQFLMLALMPALLVACGPGSSEPRQYSLQDRMDQFAATVRKRVEPKFKAAGVAYPPKKLALVAFKDTDLMQVYARNSTKSAWKWVADYPILRASGKLGPKLREGDGQVPEGIYRAELLNPNSAFHLSIRVNYPNAFDRKQAAAEKRTGLGGDIMIHGSNVSIGCLAMGDPAAEDLFVLVGHAGCANTEIVIAPTDFRRRSVTLLPVEPAWVKTLYSNLYSKLASFASPPR